MNAAQILYTRDEELIYLAGTIIGSQKLRLTLTEAVAIIRAHYV